MNNELEIEIDDDELANPQMERFVRERIAEYLSKQNKTESKASMELGQGRKYLNAISSGKALPSMKSFFRICKYLGITEKEFFSPIETPGLSENIGRAIEQMKQLSSNDIELLLLIIDKFVKSSKV